MEITQQKTCAYIAKEFASFITGHSNRTDSFKRSAMENWVKAFREAIDFPKFEEGSLALYQFKDGHIEAVNAEVTAIIKFKGDSPKFVGYAKRIESPHAT